MYPWAASFNFRLQSEHPTSTSKIRTHKIQQTMSAVSKQSLRVQNRLFPFLNKCVTWSRSLVFMEIWHCHPVASMWRRMWATLFSTCRGKWWTRMLDDSKQIMCHCVISSSVTDLSTCFRRHLILQGITPPEKWSATFNHDMPRIFWFVILHFLLA